MILMMAERPSKEELEKVKELKARGLSFRKIVKETGIGAWRVAWIMGWLRVPMRMVRAPARARVYHINRWGMVKVPSDLLATAGLHIGDEVVWLPRKGGLLLTPAKKTLPQKGPESEVGVLSGEAARMEERLRETAREERLATREA